MEEERDREEMSRLLEEIARHEEKRPMLTAVVIRREDNIPGEGFFQIAQVLGRYAGSRKPNDRLRFWIDSLNEAHDFWKKKG